MAAEPRREGRAPAGAAPLNRAAVWAALKRWGPWALALVVVLLLAQQAHRVDWHGVGQALKEQPRGELLVALALVAASHGLFASYDLVGRHMTGHGLAARRVLRIAAICYAFNLNLGSLVGGLALRLRLYGRAGLKPSVTGRVIGYSLLTNWLGYLLVGGLVLTAAPPPLGESAGVLRALGVAMLLAGMGWLLLCARSRRRRLVLRGVTFELPSARVALWQAAVASANWLLMGTVVWLLLQRALPWTEVLAVLLAGAIAGVLTHVPAGLGVLEAVFLSAFDGRMPQGELLAALLVYRALYYLLPLMLAAAGTLWSEGRWRRRRRP